MKNFIKLASIFTLTLACAGCTSNCQPQYKPHNPQYHPDTTWHQCDQGTCKHKKRNKLHTKMYTRNNHGEASEIGYVKFYDTENGVKMFVNVDKLRNGVDYTTKIYQCKDAKCTNPDTCCMSTSMSLEMPLTRKNKSDSMLQETYFIQNMTTGQLSGATVFFERDNGYRAAWGFLD